MQSSGSLGKRATSFCQVGRRVSSTSPSLERFPLVIRPTSNRNPTAAFPLIPIPSIFHEMPRTFALQVRGDSMKDAAIVEGDVVIMEFCEPRSGDIVAALIDGETTLKRYLVQRGKPFLRAENPKYPDLIPAQELVIQGVFRALIRTDKRRV